MDLVFDNDGRLNVFTDESNHANGLMFAADGRLIACEMDGRLVAWEVKDDLTAGEREVLAKMYDEKRFNAPNDLVIDTSGGIYFTDPHYRAPKPLPQGTMAVYYRAADGSVTKVADDLPTPNGILLSIDEQTLYIFPTESAQMLAGKVKRPGEVGPMVPLCTLSPNQQGDLGGADGATIDELGNLYITTQSGVEVVTPEGKSLGVLKFPEQPANVTFGGPEGRTLYVTARTSLYAMPMKVKGHRFAKPKGSAGE